MLFFRNYCILLRCSEVQQRRLAAERKFRHVAQCVPAVRRRGEAVFAGQIHARVLCAAAGVQDGRRAEGIDNGGKVLDACLPLNTTFTEGEIEIASTRMVSLTGGGLTLVPYFAWCHRGAGEMQTWFAESADAVMVRRARVGHDWWSRSGGVTDFCVAKTGRPVFGNGQVNPPA